MITSFRDGVFAAHVSPRVFRAAALDGARASAVSPPLWPHLHSQALRSALLPRLRQGLQREICASFEVRRRLLASLLASMNVPAQLKGATTCAIRSRARFFRFVTFAPTCLTGYAIANSINPNCNPSAVTPKQLRTTQSRINSNLLQTRQTATSFTRPVN